MRISGRTHTGFAVLVLSAHGIAGDFASYVIEYDPAPGQFVNLPGFEGFDFNDPTKALGPPVGGGTVAPDNSKLVTLGGFGGSITLGFTETVRDDPCNPLGLDAIVFGNASWINHVPGMRFAEVGVVEISRDVNGNGQADDPWYVIPGSSLPEPPIAAFKVQEWDDDPLSPLPPDDPSWYPSPLVFPGIGMTYTTEGFELGPEFHGPIVENPNGAAATEEGYWGYADLSPTLLLGDLSGATGSPTNDNTLTDLEDDPSIDPGRFYTVPDSPFHAGISAGSGGGDAFDIAWAVDPVTSMPAFLDGFDFIRIATGVDHVGLFGEVSAEVGGVADVRPIFEVPGDANADATVDFLDLNIVLSQIGMQGPTGDVDCDGVVSFIDLNIVLINFGNSAE